MLTRTRAAALVLAMKNIGGWWVGVMLPAMGLAAGCSVVQVRDGAGDRHDLWVGRDGTLVRAKP